MWHDKPMFQKSVLVLAAVSAVYGQAPAPAPVAVVPVRGNIYMVTGGAGSNNAFIVGPTSVILIDTKTSTDSEKEVLAAIAKVTNKPITTVLITHSDGDHINGIPVLPAGVKIIAHENEKKEVEASLARGGRGAAPKEAVATQVFTGQHQDITVDGVKLSLNHWVNAHTSGDMVIVATDAKVGFGGDIISANRPDAYIHMEKNGSAQGWLETVRGMLTLDADPWIPGHGDLQTKQDVRNRLTKLEANYAKITAMVKEGKSLGEIQTALGEQQTPEPSAPAAVGFTVAAHEALKK
jgi:glyoxylase-like metal-dependent hydrolase (beta-lactamase superfamily II)